MNRTKALDVINNPHMTEQAMDKVDRDNKLVLMVDIESDKGQIKDAVEELFEVDVQKVNTTVTPQASKKAYVSLSDTDDAMDVAAQLGMM